MEFLFEYGLFLAKSLTFLITFAIVIALIVSAGQKNKSNAEGNIEVTALNDQYNDIKDSFKACYL